MQQLANLAADHLKQHHRAAHLQAAACGARARAHQHQQQQQHLGKLRPEVKVGGSVAGGGHDGGHLKRRMPHRIGDAAVYREDINGDHRRARQRDRTVIPAFGALRRRAEFARQQQIIQIEIHAEEEHEHRNDPLKIRAVARYAVALDAKAAGSGGAEGVQHAFKQRHAARHQQHDLHQRHRHIDLIEDAGRIARARQQLAHHGAGHFRAHDVDRAIGHVRHQRHDEHQHAHAAHPMGKAAPEEQTAAHGLHIGQDRRAGGRKAADRFKKSVDIIRLITNGSAPTAETASQAMATVTKPSRA